MCAALKARSQSLEMRPGEVLLCYCASTCLDLMLLENLLPCLLQWPKDSNIQGLKQVCSVGGKTKQMNVILPSKFYQFETDV